MQVCSGVGEWREDMDDLGFPLPANLSPSQRRQILTDNMFDAFGGRFNARDAEDRMVELGLGGQATQVAAHCRLANP